MKKVPLLHLKEGYDENKVLFAHHELIVPIAALNTMLYSK